MGLSLLLLCAKWREVPTGPVYPMPHLTRKQFCFTAQDASLVLEGYTLQAPASLNIFSAQFYSFGSSSTYSVVQHFRLKMDK